MLGAVGVVDAVVGELSTRLPAKTTELGVRWGREVPSVIQVLGHEPDQVGVEGWPLVVVTAVDDRDWRPLGDGAWVVSYGVRFTTWVRGDSYESTTFAQRALHLAVVECLLSDVDVDGVRVDDRSLVSSMSDIATTDSGRTIAGARLDVRVSVEEHLPAPDPVAVVVEPPDIGLLPG